MDYILNFIYNKFLRSLPSKILIFIGIISAALSIIFKDNIKIVIYQVIAYFLFSSIVNCMIYGGCELGAWSLIIVPVLGAIIIILNKINYFKNLNNKIKKINNYLKKHEIIIPNYPR